MFTQEEFHIQQKRLKQLYINLQSVLDSNGGDTTDAEYLSVRSVIYEVQNALREHQNEREVVIREAAEATQARIEKINALLANTAIINS